MRIQMGDERISFVPLFLGFLLVATGASCPITLSPKAVVVKYGDPVSINCSTTESEFEGIGWEATRGGTGLEKVNPLTWTLANLTEWTMSPSCFFNPSPDSQFNQCSSRPSIILYTFPESLNISSSSDGPMTEMENYTFTCEINNVAPVQYLTVKWYKGDSVIFTSSFSSKDKQPENLSPVLDFKPTRDDDGLAIRCEAELYMGQEGPRLNASSQDYIMKVYYGPDVQCLAPEILEGETLEKHCPVKGNPTPSVKWLKDEKPTEPTVPLKRENAGTYTVKAKGHSVVEKKIRVAVLYGPELRCPATYTAQEYAPHSLTCTVEGYPKPETVWYKDGEEVELPDNLTRMDAGQYVITASNHLSSVNLTVDITVMYPPLQIVELEDSQADVGSTVWLKCSSVSNPRPQYFWNYYRTANVIEENEDGVSRLLIHNATAYNTGSYTCHAWNDRGNISKTAMVTVKGVKQECPIEISPDRMVIQYQGTGQSATCKPTSTGSRNIEGEISWQVLQGTKTYSTSWFADTQKDWDPRPVCTASFKGIGTCQKYLDFTLYKTPDSVSIRPVGNLSSVVEETEFQLQCDITNVAPARHLAVRWYRGNKVLETRAKGSMRVTGCPSENDADCAIGVVRFPVNVTSTINITLSRKDGGEELRCEALLDLGPEGPQLPPNKTSSPLNITVYYKPIINTTKLPKVVPVFRGYPEELVCEADGHPPPKIQWHYSTDKAAHVSGDKTAVPGDKITVSAAGFFRCSATNEVDSVTHVVEVILKEDYLPLIAGFVAVTVVAISIVFLFIYSIYYKNTRMRRYSLKNPKLSTHNGNVAHNGWDLPLPMTKLS